MYYKLLSIDNNTSKGNTVIGEIDYFKYDGIRFYFATMTSSPVKSINKTNDELLVQTKNSLYTFKESK